LCGAYHTSATDSHADDIIQIVREEFGEGNQFCKKITYNVKDEKPEDVWSQGHSRTIDAANIAARANVKMLILTHISARYEGLEEKLLEEARRYFKNTYIAYDLQKFYIEPY